MSAIVQADVGVRRLVNPTTIMCKVRLSSGDQSLEPNSRVIVRFWQRKTTHDQKCGSIGNHETYDYGIYLVNDFID